MEFPSKIPDSADETLRQEISSVDYKSFDDGVQVATEVASVPVSADATSRQEIISVDYKSLDDGVQVAEESASADATSRQEISSVDYKSLDDVVQVAEESGRRTRNKKYHRKKRRKDDPDYNPIACSAKKTLYSSPDGKHSKRARQPVDYTTLDGGSKSDEDSEEHPRKAKLLRSASKRARVEVSLGVPPEGGEVVHEAAATRPQTATKPPQRRLVLVRVPTDGSASSRPLNPNEGATRHMVLVPVPSKPTSARNLDPYELDDALFNKEVNKFLAASMTNDLSRDVLPRPKPEILPDTDPSPSTGPAASKARTSAARCLIRSSEAVQSNAVITGTACPAQDLSDEITSCAMCGSRIRGRQMKKHALVCKGVLMTWSESGYVCSAQSPSMDRASMRFACPRCEKVLHSDEEFQVHVATEHGFFWRLDFSSEADYQQWCLAEGFAETMISGQSKRSPHLEERSFYCAMNSTRKAADLKCPCRKVVKKRPEGVSVRYFPAHNHSDRVVKRAMTRECRDLVVRSLRAGRSNAGVLAEVRRVFPDTSHNHHISKELVSSIRYKLRQAGELQKGRCL